MDTAVLSIRAEPERVPKVNVTKFVRDVFDSFLIEQLVPKTVEDAELFVIQQLEQYGGRKLTTSETWKLGLTVTTEWNTRAALKRIATQCVRCARRFRIDEARYNANVCVSCTSDLTVFVSTVREQLRAEGLGVEDLR